MRDTVDEAGGSRPAGIRFSRRKLLAAGAGTVGLVLAGWPLSTLVAGAPASNRSALRRGGLIDDPAGLLALPEGFTYRVLLREGDPLSDGTPRPGRADGMWAFPTIDGMALLCLNHENEPLDVVQDGALPVPHVPGDYDPSAVGGTSVVLVADDLSVAQAWISSSGTTNNCGGGRTPWDTWITCEEIDSGAQHGWAFEVDPYAPLNGGIPRQVRLDPFGRFEREAVAIDPLTRVVYMTEDQPDGLLYRFVPEGRPNGYGEYAAAAGTLQALRIPRWPDANVVEVGVDLTPEWVDVPDPSGDPLPTRLQTFASGPPTVFCRAEGMTWGAMDESVYFDCTGGFGAGHEGQIWRYTPATNTLRMLLVSRDPALLSMPDNVSVMPGGHLIICEDGLWEMFVRILTTDGRLLNFARSQSWDGHLRGFSEFAGACFAPGGDTLFLNLQDPSMTVAIQGPWTDFLAPPSPHGARNPAEVTAQRLWAGIRLNSNEREMA